MRNYGSKFYVAGLVLTLSAFVYCSLGLTTFLAGEPPEEPREELRTAQVPQTIVESWEELRNYKYETPATTKVNGEEKSVAQKQEKKKESSVPADTSSDIDISKLDIRVGVINKAWEHPEAEKLYCEEIDIGEESGPRQIASGLKAYYSVDELIGRKVLVLANLKARKLVGFASHGMVLCASSDEAVKFIDPPEGAAIGERVFVEGYEGEAATENQVIKKKILEAIFPDLKTNEKGEAIYKGVPLSTSAGPCTSGLPNAPIA